MGNVHPVEMSLSTPPIPEETSREEDRTRNHGRDAELGFADAVVAAFEATVEPVVEARCYLRTNLFGESVMWLMTTAKKSDLLHRS